LIPATIKMRYGTRLFCFFAISFIGFNAAAQTMELGVVGGGAGYMGDLNQTKPLKISGMSAGAYVKMNFDRYWGLGIHYNFGKIKANDLSSDNAQFRDRGLNFKTSLNEISLQVDFNFLDYFAGGGTKRFTPYIFTGIGGVFFIPKGYYTQLAELGDQEYNLRFYRTEGQNEPYKNYALTVPYGVGFKVRLKENWGLFSQIGYRSAFTDYLDDVSGKYPGADNPPADGDRGLMLSDPNRGPLVSGIPRRTLSGTQRGDFRKRDTYMFVGIGISYTFVSQKCYTF
jgi:hypothetical protein